jgi:serine/threonine protein kinase
VRLEAQLVEVEGCTAQILRDHTDVHGGVVDEFKGVMERSARKLDVIQVDLLRLRESLSDPDKETDAAAVMGGFELSGAFGTNADNVNGIYMKTSELCNAKPVYLKMGDSSRCCWYDPTMTWMVGDITSKDTNTAAGNAHCVEERLDVPQLAKEWKVCEGVGKWKVQATVTITDLAKHEVQSAIAACKLTIAALGIKISGATGTCARLINGMYAKSATERGNGMAVYVRVGAPDVHCSYEPGSKKWTVSTSDRSVHYATSVHTCLDAPQLAMQWQVWFPVLKEWKRQSSMTVTSMDDDEVVAGVTACCWSITAASCAEQSALAAPGFRLIGANGKKRFQINGIYTKTTETKNGKPVYLKVGSSDLCCYFGPDKQWMFTNIAEKNANTTAGKAFSVEVGLEAPQLALLWKVWPGGDADYEFQPSVITSSCNAEDHHDIVVKSTRIIEHSQFRIKGTEKSNVDGNYIKMVGKSTNGRAIYKKEGYDDVYCFYSPDKQWWITDASDVNANKSSGWALTTKPNMDAPQLAGYWKVINRDGQIWKVRADLAISVDNVGNVVLNKVKRELIGTTDLGAAPGFTFTGTATARDGVYVRNGRGKNGKCIYEKLNDPEKCCWYTKTNRWVVSDRSDLIAGKDIGHAFSCEYGLAAPQFSLNWETVNNGKLTEKPCVAAATFTAEEQQTVAMIRKMHMNAPGLLITRATGNNADHVNGIYMKTSELCNAKPVYLKMGDSSRCCWYDPTMTWMVGDITSKDANKAAGNAHCVEERLDAPQLAKEWKVSGGVGKWDVQTSVTVDSLTEDDGERYQNHANGHGARTHIQIQLTQQRHANALAGKGGFTDIELKKQCVANAQRGYLFGSVTDATVAMYKREEAAHVHAGLGPHTTAVLTARAIEAAASRIAGEQATKKRKDLDRRAAWFERWGAGFVHTKSNAGEAAVANAPATLAMMDWVKQALHPSGSAPSYTALKADALEIYSQAEWDMHQATIKQMLMARTESVHKIAPTNPYSLRELLHDTPNTEAAAAPTPSVDAATPLLDSLRELLHDTPDEADAAPAELIPSPSAFDEITPEEEELLSPPSFPPGPIPTLLPLSELDIDAVAICMALECSTTFSFFTRRGTCSVCSAVVCKECISDHVDMPKGAKVCPTCSAMISEKVELDSIEPIEWAHKEAMAQVTAAREVKAQCEAAEEAFSSAESALERARKVATVKVNAVAEEAKKLAASLSSQVLLDQQAADRRKTVERAAAEEAKLEAERRKKAFVTAQLASAAAECVLENNEDNAFSRFKVPASLEMKVVDVERTFSLLNELNKVLQTRPGNLGAKSSESSASSNPTGEGSDPAVDARDQARGAYLIAVSALVNANLFCRTRSRNAKAVVDVLCSTSIFEQLFDSLDDEDIQSTPTPSEPKSADDAAIKAVTKAVETWSLSKEAKFETAEETSLGQSGTLDESVPTMAVVSAIRWMKVAAPLALGRFADIAKAAEHHEACADTMKDWCDPEVKKHLLMEVKLARDAKKKTRKLLKIATVTLETVDSDDSGDDGANSKVLEEAVRSAKVAYSKAVKAEIKVQARFALAIRDHYPELVDMLDMAGDPIYKLMEQLESVPVYESRAHYELGDRIQGGTHEVQRATNTIPPDLDSPTNVVLKRFVLGDASSRKTFEKELQILARMRHPNVIQLTGVVYEPKEAVAYLELPYLASGDLRSHLGDKEANRNTAEIQQLFSDLCKALDYLHTSGVVHCDVKPDNILIDGNGTAKLTDFDVSKDARSRALAVGTTASTTKAIGGLTYGYAAPEVMATAAASGSAASGILIEMPGAPADMWSAGCVLFFMAFYPRELTMETGKAPIAELPCTCNEALRCLLVALWTPQPNRRPTAAETLTAPYLAVESHRAMSAREAAIGNVAKSLSGLKQQAVAPAYWQAHTLTPAAPTCRIDVTDEMKGRIEWLMQNTAKPEFHGEGRDSHGVKFAGFGVAKVWRIENHQLWMDYAHKRASLASVNKDSDLSIRPPVSTAQFVVAGRQDGQLGASLHAPSNEHFLFHGTKIESLDALCDRGFDPAVGSLGGFLGSGCYFGENSSKSDEYVPPAAKQYMFLCRVALGQPFSTPKEHRQLRRPPCLEGHFDEPCSHRRFDSLLATTKATDSASFLLKFREFVVYDKMQCYPEYLIEYMRLTGEEEKARRVAAKARRNKPAKMNTAPAAAPKEEADLFGGERDHDLFGSAKKGDDDLDWLN